MERAERAALYIFFCGVGLAMLAATGPLAFPDAPKIIWQGIFWVSAAIAILSAIFLAYEYRHVARAKRVTPLVGMIVFGLGFIACAAWYFWPTIHSSPTKLTAPQQVPSLLSLFMTDFMSRNGMIWNASADIDQVTGDTKRTIHLYYQILNDFDANSKFISFYVPSANPTSDVINFIAKNYHGYFIDIESKHWAVWKGQGTADIINTKILLFSGRVYIYHEEPFSVEQMGDFVKLFRENGAAVQFRGPDYIIAVLQSIQAGAVKPPPRYEIKDGRPILAP